MLNETSKNKPEPVLEKQLKMPSKPNESGRLEVMDFVRIYDPNSQEPLLEKRG